jgi:hypothetical protein
MAGMKKKRYRVADTLGGSLEYPWEWSKMGLCRWVRRRTGFPVGLRHLFGCGDASKRPPKGGCARALRCLVPALDGRIDGPTSPADISYVPHLSAGPDMRGMWAAWLKTASGVCFGYYAATAPHADMAPLFEGQPYKRSSASNARRKGLTYVERDLRGIYASPLFSAIMIAYGNGHIRRMSPNSCGRSQRSLFFEGCRNASGGLRPSHLGRELNYAIGGGVHRLKEIAADGPMTLRESILAEGIIGRPALMEWRDAMAAAHSRSGGDCY